MPVECVKQENMGLSFGLEQKERCPKQKHRWLFQIEGVSAVANALPPLKSHRPHLEFREQQVAHLVQNIYYPVQPEWKPIQLTLYDIKKNANPVFDWVSMIYNASGSKSSESGQKEWNPVYRAGCEEQCFKRNALLCMYDGCGNVIERWKYENCYPMNINWGELDMATAEMVVVEVMLRYDRAYLVT